MTIHRMLKVSAAATCSLLNFTSLEADIVRLESGAVLRGQVLSSDAQFEKDEPVRIRKLDGDETIVPAGEVRTIERRPLKVEEYELRAEKLDDTLEAHWQMAEWCRAQQLIEQRRLHLERVLDFDPDHRQAHYGLGHTRKNGQWLTRDEYEQQKRDSGLVKHGGKWVPADQLDAIQAQEAKTRAELDWYPKVRIWLKQAGGSDPKRAGDGLVNLRSIRSPEAVPALIQFLGKDERADVRRLFVAICAQVGGERPVPSLALLAVRDQVRDIRDSALAALSDDQRDVAMTVLLASLQDRNNAFVRRAADAIAKVGTDAAVPALIRALVTKHSYKISVPVESYSVSSAGGLSGVSLLPPDVQAGLLTGIYDPETVFPFRGGPVATKDIMVSVEHQNPEVLDALRHFTSMDFGFNENAWQRWWTVERNQQQTAPDLP